MNLTQKNGYIQNFLSEPIFKLLKQFQKQDEFLSIKNLVESAELSWDFGYNLVIALHQRDIFTLVDKGRSRSVQKTKRTDELLESLYSVENLLKED